MKKLLLFLLILVAVIILGWSGYYYWQGTPRYSLYQMAKAIKNNDPQTFLVYIDMDQVLEGLVAEPFEEMRRKFSPNADSKAPPQKESFRRNKRLQGIISQLAQVLKPELEQQLIRAIQDIEQKDRISPFSFAFLSQVREEGNKAQVTVRAPKDETYQFTMERMPEKVWKVIKLDVDFFKFFKKVREQNE